MLNLTHTVFNAISNFVVFQVAESLNKLIRTHQRIPGSITHGILDRLPYFRNKYVNSLKSE